MAARLRVRDSWGPGPRVGHGPKGRGSGLPWDPSCGASPPPPRSRRLTPPRPRPLQGLRDGLLNAGAYGMCICSKCFRTSRPRRRWWTSGSIIYRWWSRHLDRVPRVGPTRWVGPDASPRAAVGGVPATLRGWGRGKSRSPPPRSGRGPSVRPQGRGGGPGGGAPASAGLPKGVVLGQQGHLHHPLQKKREVRGPELPEPFRVPPYPVQEVPGDVVDVHGWRGTPQPDLTLHLTGLAHRGGCRQVWVGTPLHGPLRSSGPSVSTFGNRTLYPLPTNCVSYCSRRPTSPRSLLGGRVRLRSLTWHPDVSCSPFPREGRCPPVVRTRPHTPWGRGRPDPTLQTRSRLVCWESVTRVTGSQRSWVR